MVFTMLLPLCSDEVWLWYHIKFIVQPRHPKGPLKNRFIRGWSTQLYKHLSCSWIIQCGTILNSSSTMAKVSICFVCEKRLNLSYAKLQHKRNKLVIKPKLWLSPVNTVNNRTSQWISTKSSQRKKVKTTIQAFLATSTIIIGLIKIFIHESLF